MRALGGDGVKERRGSGSPHDSQSPVGNGLLGWDRLGVGLDRLMDRLG